MKGRLLAVLSAIALVGACSSGKSGVAGAGGSGATDGGGSGGTAGGGGTGGGISLDSGPGDSGACANNGDPCGDGGGVCAGGTCCESTPACGDACCKSGEVCAFQKCVTPGATCHDSSECAQNEYCDFALGNSSGNDAGSSDGGTCTGGATQTTGKCLPRPPACATGQQPGNPPACIQTCEYKPPSTSFSPVVKYSWGGVTSSPYSSDIMMTPVVIELDDDDCDGKVTAKDIPEVVFSTFSSGQYRNSGVLHAISVVGGKLQEKWSVPNVVYPTKQLAAGNIDGKPGNEVVACGIDGKVHAFNGDGSQLWVTATATSCFMPSIADLDGDGTVEVVVEGGILDGATGALEHAFSTPLASSFVVSDIDGDGKLDIVTGSQGFDAQGQPFVDTGTMNQSQFFPTGDWKSPWPAVADFDGDGKPEVVVVDNLSHAIGVWRYDATQPGKFKIVRSPVDINGTLNPSTCGTGWGATHGGGPPTVADFNGDGTPDVALAGGVGYVVFDGKKLVDSSVSGPNTILWTKATHDCSSASTGSTVFDFNGDGVAEVIYSDELHLRIYNGPDGSELFSTCNTTATLIENPIVADVDNDGHADIVAISNAYAEQCDDGTGTKTRQSGVRVFGDPNGKWVRTRRVWNEHAYHVTNVGEDGAIPQHEADNWTQSGLDNFRQNKQPGSEFAAPDAVVTLELQCTAPQGVRAIVQNLGEAALPAGVVVGLYQGTAPNGTQLATTATTRALYSAESETLFFPESLDPSLKFYAVVDDGGAPHPSWVECRANNNTSPTITAACPGIR